MFDKTIRDYVGFAEPYAAMAEDRVTAEPELSPLYDLLIGRSWLDHGDHWRWVAMASVEDLVAWAKDIRADEEDAAEDEEPFKYEQATRLTITVYSEQLQVVDKVARRHGGKRSPAIREMINYWERALTRGEQR